MAEFLRILILEDDAADAELVQSVLQESGLVFTAKVVTTKEDYLKGLQEFSPDVILSDYDLPQYSGAQALAEAKRHCPDVPFILITGVVSENCGINTLGNEARDYFIKCRLEQQLVPTIKRTLAEVEEYQAWEKAKEIHELNRNMNERVKILTAELEAEKVTRKNMEETLRESESRYRVKADHTYEMVFLVNSAGQFQDLSPSAEQIIGRKISPNAEAGELLKQIVHPEDLEKRLAHLREELVDHVAGDMEFRILRPDGEARWMHHVCQPVYDTDGLFLGTRIFARDITRHKKAEEALRKSEARFRLLSITAGRLLGSDDPQAIVEDLCSKVMKHLDCQFFSNFLVDEHAGKLHLNACAGIPQESVRIIEWLDYGIAICGLVALEKSRITLEDVSNTDNARTEFIKSHGIQAYCCHPLISQNDLIGTLSFGTRTRTRFAPEEVELMQMVADQVAMALQRKQVEQNLQEAKKYLEHRVEERTKELKAASLYTRRLIETNLDPLVTINAKGKITDVNVATELVTGLSRSELLGSDFSDYFTEPEKARAGYEKGRLI